MRDYDAKARGRNIVKPYGVREVGDKRYVIFQVWDFDGQIYDLTMYFVEEDRRSSATHTHALRSRYYAVSPDRVLSLMQEAGFTAARRMSDVFYQPVLVGTRPS